MIYVYHHNDLDGIVSAAVIQELHYSYGETGIDFIELDYKEKINLEGYDAETDILYFVDYSFSLEENIKQLDAAIERGLHIIWIDHHDTSIRLLKEHFKFETETDIPSPEFAAREGLFNMRSFRANFEYLISKNCSAAMLCYIYSMWYISKDESHYLHNYCKLIDYDKFIEEPIGTPHGNAFIEMVSNYDTFQLSKDGTTEEFYYGANSMIMIPNCLFRNVLDGYDSLFSMHPYEANASITKYMSDAIKTGSIIRDAENTRFSMERKSKLFAFKIDDRIHNKVLNCYGMNISSNSMSFGEFYNKADAVCPFYITKEGYFKYSLFQPKERDDDLSFYAETIGKTEGAISGGGHAHACGFIHKDLIVRPNSTITFYYDENKEVRVKY